MLIKSRLAGVNFFPELIMKRSFSESDLDEGDVFQRNQRE